MSLIDAGLLLTLTNPYVAGTGSPPARIAQAARTPAQSPDDAPNAGGREGEVRITATSPLDILQEGDVLFLQNI
ncbi:MAG: hypothetical protein ACREP9_16375 [Candidatus Dormibacteraceae bacterium]